MTDTTNKMADEAADIDRSLDQTPDKTPVRAQAPQGPLSGVRVLDLSAVVSGPMAAMVLADQGADVIKVEPPGWGDGIRHLGATHNGVSAIFCMINRNKRSIAINWKTPAGAALVRKLASTCDVLLQNYRPGKLDRAGLGFEDLQQSCPDLIYTSVNGMGETGPYAGQKVYDYVIQGISGVTDAQGVGGGKDGQKMVRTIVYDKVTSLTVAQGITAALFARERGAGGQHLRLSMLDAGLQFNWPDLMWNHSFLSDSGEVQLSGDLADMYEVISTADGAIVSHPLGGDASGYSTEELLTLFAQNDVPVARANSRAEVPFDPQVVATEALVSYEHPRAGLLRQPRSSMRFEGTPLAPIRPAPEVGEHTVEILTELGMSEEEMSELAAQGVFG